MNYLSILLEYLGIDPPPGVPPETIAKLEAESGLRLHESARELYAACNGVVLEETDMEILPLEKAIDLYRELSDDDEDPQAYMHPGAWDSLPFTECNDSNHFCICCGGELSGYVIYFRHDNEPQVVFRSLDAFFAGYHSSLLRREALSEDDEGYWCDLIDASEDFSGNFRTPHDIATGRALLRRAGELEGTRHFDAVLFGITLLSEEEVEEIIPFLDDADEYVREAVGRRLSAMSAPAARRSLDASRDDMVRFVAECADVLRRVGLDAMIVDEVMLRIDPGPMWLNMKMFYSRRREPGFMDYFVERVKYLWSLRARS